MTKYINLHSQLTNITKKSCLSYVVLCSTQFSFDAAHIVEYYLRKTVFFSYVVTKYINLHSQLTNVTKKSRLSYVVLCDTQFSFDAAHIVEYNLTAVFISLCYKTCHFVFNYTI